MKPKNPIKCEHKNAYINPTSNALRCPDCNSIKRRDGIWEKVTEYHIGTKHQNEQRIKGLAGLFEEAPQSSGDNSSENDQEGKPENDIWCGVKTLILFENKRHMNSIEDGFITNYQIKIICIKTHPLVIEVTGKGETLYYATLQLSGSEPLQLGEFKTASDAKAALNKKIKNLGLQNQQEAPQSSGDNPFHEKPEKTRIFAGKGDTKKYGLWDVEANEHADPIFETNDKNVLVRHILDNNITIEYVVGGIKLEAKNMKALQPSGDFCSCGKPAEYVCDCGEPCCGEDPCIKGCGGSVNPIKEKPSKEEN